MDNELNSERDATAFDVFRYLGAEKCALYREIMHAFVEAKERFAIHLKPEDVVAALRESGDAGGAAGGVEPGDVETALVQLRQWGNVKAHADNAEVRTLEDFYRARFLYQLSAEGEAAERALAFYREQIERPGELQSAALDDIEAILKELEGLLAAPTRDVVKLHTSCSALYARFEGLAARAQQFMGSVQRAIDLQGSDVQAFLAYKERLIEYLERFIGELVLKSPKIAARIGAVEAAGMTEALELLARRELEDVLEDHATAAARIRHGWTVRWRGLRTWFFGQAGEPSQSERLRNRARSAIPDLLAVVASLNARRVRRSDRAEDLRTLARWFAECESDADAHVLWRSAFCLYPSRHLTIDADSLNRREEAPVSPRASWLEAEPLWLSPHLRATGRVRRFGRQPAIADDADAKRLLGELLREEHRQLEEARRRIVAGQARHLSDFAELDRAALDLFLDCLGAALARRTDDARAVETYSSDGSLRIRLEPVPDARWVTLATREGWFSGRDCLVLIEEAAGEARPA